MTEVPIGRCCVADNWWNSHGLATINPGDHDGDMVKVMPHGIINAYSFLYEGDIEIDGQVWAIGDSICWRHLLSATKLIGLIAEGAIIMLTRDGERVTEERIEMEQVLNALS